MTTAQLVGLVILAAMTVPLLWLIRPLLDYRRICREWDVLQAAVDECRADFGCPDYIRTNVVEMAEAAALVRERAK